MTALAVIAALALAALAALALLLDPPAGGLRRVADADFLADFGTDDEPAPAEPAPPADCPDWCAERPGHYTACHAVVGARHTVHAWMEVELLRPPGRETTILLTVSPGLSEAGMEAHLTPVEAAVLSAAITIEGGARLSGALGAALAGECGWVAETLARAAAMAGAPACDDCGRVGDVRPEYRRDGSLVERCGTCHQAALTGTGVAR